MPSTRRKIEIVNPDQQDIDLLICVLGFEARCVKVPNIFRESKCAKWCLSFQDRKKYSYHKNLQFYKENTSFELIDYINETTIKECLDRIRSLSLDQEIVDKGYINIAVDISSMTRRMFASLMSEFCGNSFATTDMHVTIYYAQGKYYSPSSEFPAVRFSGPVIDEYAGWTEYPEDPNFVITGLGFEHNMAIGANEHLDVSGAWLLVPNDNFKEFHKTVLKLNHMLIDSVSPHNVINYNVDNPYDTYIILRSLVEGLEGRGKLVMLPFGPKLLSALMVIVAEQYFPRIGVWRISGGVSEEGVDREAIDAEPVKFSIRITSPET